MVQINRLRLSGFKSFVDKTELDIGSGLNGIVGPNGCGKSNLVEALRWVMGENRAKHMRSGDMEDVIFAGTALRPARSIAEVSVLLDNSDGLAPHPFTNSTQIEVTRRIERDKGSQYLVNGKAVRARDVQMLFADSMTGAHSPALVSQGRVTQLIQAKPSERRQMLEESAGVASLYTRRHEAELRLKAADENLARLDLVIGELGGRANALRAQAKQAVRYRDLSENIRRLEALLAWQDWAATRDKLKKEENRFAEADAHVREALVKSTGLNVAAADAVTKAEALREEDIEARAALQLLRQTLEQLEREAGHRRHEFDDLNRQLEQAHSDLRQSHEQRDTLAARAQAISAELAALPADADAPEGLAELERQLAEAQEAVRYGENDVLAQQDKIRSFKNAADAARAALTRADADVQRTHAKLAELEAQYARVAQDGPEEADLAAAHAALDEIRARRAQSEEALAARQAELEHLRDAYTAAREALAALQQEKTLKAREIKGLQDMLARLAQGYEGSYLLSLDLPPELAVAIASAAGDAAMRAHRDDWAGHGEAFAATEWADGIMPLSSLINVPDALAAFVSSVGIVDTAADVTKFGGVLKRGQILASRDGHVVRWDGLAIRKDAEAEDAESRILTLRAQIKSAEAAAAALTPAIDDADAAMARAASSRDELAATVAQLQTQARDAAAQAQGHERRIDTLQKTVNDRSVRRSLLDGQRQQAAEAVRTAEETLVQARAVDAGTHDDKALETLGIDLKAFDEILSDRRARRDGLSTQIETVKAAARQAKHMRATLESEAARTTDQLTRMQAQAASLDARITDLGARRDALAPAIADDAAGTAKSAVLDKIAEAEAAAHKASDAFATLDAQAKALQSDLKAVEEQGASARERRAVVQATIAALQGDQTRQAGEIEDRFSCSPSALENAVMVDWPEGLPAQSKARSERDHLLREREAMGPVNLRAEVELEEAVGEANRLESEKADLAAAIERLREGIAKLNGEARERIVKTFTDVNQHFQLLFKRLFGGGEAYLKLVDSDDPLDAGLEIFAQPPGKSLQSLSLLSGGEQTLTAIAMIFAMFLSNPSPVCVLDEVDAPLDDANVDRVCGLLEEMSTKCATRFLVISHHRMTMARMDRLYGVTMAERGVSQLVSVNLAAQGDLLAHLKAA